MDGSTISIAEKGFKISYVSTVDFALSARRFLRNVSIPRLIMDPLLVDFCRNKEKGRY